MPSLYSSNDYPDDQQRAFTVSELNSEVRSLLENNFPSVLVEGEISNFSRPASGHWYFTLKDESAQVRCAMFRSRNMAVRFKPENGAKVQLRARLSLYEGRGDYQLLVDRMEAAGDGALQKAFEALKAKLHAEGLLDADRKQPLPSTIRHIGVITSPTGAAIHDILSVLNRRFPALGITLLPVPVQGQEAAPAMIRALATANARRGPLSDLDVIIIGRGGGSLEDLWAFNDEALARAIAQSALPVISAVGHEVDFSIADFVAFYSVIKKCIVRC
jgi:exodeoxyribonuclease VII large subunit